MAFQAE